ncbi:hypothetical protein DLAC_06467 [Tieghemostelium lacteum]|uniref:Uncharacterized protein n=1 Tax=Tieghemostelium lacteum TaxID=361077 RepID=A0A151ZF35_TIELA|nr:hypothetical protein DLAC_06467 [Tieghemostelium lacteum]|eukprot:KYQ92484.1 hypothetical protein DLAC_06467 [Tieghemostelium lacteum]
MSFIFNYIYKYLGYNSDDNPIVSQLPNHIIIKILTFVKPYFKDVKSFLNVNSLVSKNWYMNIVPKFHIPYLINSIECYRLFQFRDGVEMVLDNVTLPNNRLEQDRLIHHLRINKLPNHNSSTFTQYVIDLLNQFARRPNDFPEFRMISIYNSRINPTIKMNLLLNLLEQHLPGPIHSIRYLKLKTSLRSIDSIHRVFGTNLETLILSNLKLQNIYSGFQILGNLIDSLPNLRDLQIVLSLNSQFQFEEFVKETLIPNKSIVSFKFRCNFSQSSISEETLVEYLNTNKVIQNLVFDRLGIDTEILYYENVTAPEIVNNTLIRLIVPSKFYYLFGLWNSNSVLETVFHCSDKAIESDIALNTHHRDTVKRLVFDLYHIRPSDIQETLKLEIPNLTDIIIKYNHIKGPSYVLQCNIMQCFFDSWSRDTKVYVNTLIITCQISSDILIQIISFNLPSLKKLHYFGVEKERIRLEVLKTIAKNNYIEDCYINRPPTVRYADLPGLILNLLNCKNLKSFRLLIPYAYNYFHSMIGIVSSLKNAVQSNLDHLEKIYISEDFTEYILKNFNIPPYNPYNFKI